MLNRLKKCIKEGTDVRIEYHNGDEKDFEDGNIEEVDQTGILLLVEGEKRLAFPWNSVSYIRLYDDEDED